MSDGIRQGGIVGNGFQSLGDYPKAIDYHKKDWEFQLKCLIGPGNEESMKMLIRVYLSFGDFCKAIEYHEKR